MMKHVKVHVQEVTREGWMKHVANGREESETARENSQGVGPENP